MNTPTEAGHLQAYRKDYLEYLQEERRFTESSLETITTSLNTFTHWCNLRGLVDVREIGRKEIDRYEKYLFHFKKKNGETLSFLTQGQKISGLKGFFRWLLKQNRILYNPTLHLKLPREGKTLPRFVLTAEEALKVLCLAGMKTKRTLRDRAILETFYSTGIRRSELMMLFVHDVDFNKESLFIRKGKGQKDRVVPIGKTALYFIEKYLTKVRGFWQNNHSGDFLFLTPRGFSLDKNMLSALVTAYVDRARLGKKGSCHLFRHSMATQMLENGASIRYVQEMLGHSRLETTERYTHVSLVKLKEVYARCHPAAVSESENTKTVAKARTRRNAPQGLTGQPKKVQEEICLLAAKEMAGKLESIEIQDKVRLRDRAILELLLCLGLKQGEVVKARLSDLSMERLSIRVNERELPLTYRASFWLKRYLAEGRKRFYRHGQSAYLFLTDQGVHLNRVNFVRQVSAYFEGKRITCNMWRSSWAFMMQEQKCPVDVIAQIMGEESMSVDFYRLRRIFHNFHPFCLYKEPKEIVKPLSPWDGELKSYLEYLQMKNYSKHTIQSRKDNLLRFIKWCRQNAVEDPHGVGFLHVQDFRKYLYQLQNRQGKPLSASTLRSLLLSVSSFFERLTLQNEILFNPAKELDLPRAPKSLPSEIWSVDEVEKIMQTPDTTTLLGLRDRAILETFYATAMRREELSNLLLEHVNLKEKMIFINQGKGKKDRYVPVSQRTAFWILKYLNEARNLLCQGRKVGHFFVNFTGGRMSPITVRALVTDYVNKSGISKKGSTLGFRHAAATHMLENGADIRYIQELLGHASLETTKIYTRVHIGKLKEVHKNTHPAEKEKS